MGVRLAEEVLAASWPTPLTHREKLLLLVLALDANDGTRLTWNSIESPEILHAAQLNRPQLYAVVKQLIAKGALRRTVAGQRNAAAKYVICQCPQIPDTDVPQCQEIADPEPEPQCQENPDTDQSQCPQIPDTDGLFSVSKSLTLNQGSVSGNPALSVRESLTPTRTTRTKRDRERARATAAPDRFDVTDDMRAWAAEKGIPDARRVDSETERFLDHHRAKGNTFKDWRAAWRNWMSRSLDYAPRATQQRPTATSHATEWMHQ